MAKRVSQTYIRTCLERRVESIVKKLTDQIQDPPEIAELRANEVAAYVAYQAAYNRHNELNRALNDYENQKRRQIQEIRSKVQRQKDMLEEKMMFGDDNAEILQMLNQFSTWEPQ